MVLKPGKNSRIKTNGEAIATLVQRWEYSCLAEEIQSVDGARIYFSSRKWETAPVTVQIMLSSIDKKSMAQRDALDNETCIPC